MATKTTLDESQLTAMQRVRYHYFVQELESIKNTSVLSDNQKVQVLNLIKPKIEELINQLK